MSDEQIKLIQEAVAKALAGDMDMINNIEDRVTRSKAKAALVKAKREAKKSLASDTEKPSSAPPPKPSVGDEPSFIDEVVAKALAGDMDAINNIEDRVTRSKAKAALVKAKREAKKSSAADTEKPQSAPPSKPSAGDEKLSFIDEVVAKALAGDMDAINNIEDRITRSKAKAALVKAKREAKKGAVPSKETVQAESIPTEKTLNQKVAEAIEKKFPSSLTGDDVDGHIQLKGDDWFNIAHYLKDSPDFLFDSLQCITGFDLGLENDLEVRYNLHSMTHNHTIEIRIQTDRKDPKIPSVEQVWRIGDWFERETYDMYGIIFEGHRNMTRILLPDDWEGWPLLKDYEAQETYHGIVIPKVKEGWE
jgi:NADH-quinone oxidoreductase subunit C